MSTGSLQLNITDLRGEPIDGPLHIDFKPVTGSPGGTPMVVDFKTPGETEFVVEGLPCLGGPGTRYIVRITTRNFRTYAFFQMILEERVNTASDSQIRLMVKPKRITGIDALPFASLPAELMQFLESAAMRAIKAEDRDLIGLRGSELYDSMGALRRACILNIFRKATHATSDGCFRFLRSPMVLRQDRCFCEADPDLPEFLRQSDRFKSAPNTLHDPLPGYRLEDSFKSRDAHANIQVTFMRHKETNVLAADVDIDEASGIEHGFEVIRNAVTGGRTNPYLVRELMLLFDPVEKVLDPGYRFVFG